MITLKTLHLATAQEVYDQVKTHLLTQNCKSQDPDLGFCKYLGPNNTKCAAGCLISDDEYEYDMEGTLWAGLVDRNIITRDHLNLIEDLQTVHDHYEVIRWGYKLSVVATKYNLNP
jgi:hypothetical protein